MGTVTVLGICSQCGTRYDHKGFPYQYCDPCGLYFRSAEAQQTANYLHRKGKS